jgi:hypothetical protein
MARPLHQGPAWPPQTSSPEARSRLGDAVTIGPLSHRSAGATPTKKLLPTVRHPLDEAVVPVAAWRSRDQPAGTILETSSGQGSGALNEVARALDRYILEGRPRHAILQFICDDLGAAMAIRSCRLRWPSGRGEPQSAAAAQGTRWGRKRSIPFSGTNRSPARGLTARPSDRADAVDGSRGDELRLER